MLTAFFYLQIGFNKSKLFATAPSDVVNILASEPVTANFHRYCVTKEVGIEL